MKKIFLTVFVIICFFGQSCKEKYEPPVIKSDLNVLVVDGFLNNSTDTSFIRLSRTKKLQDGIANSAENGASLYVEDAAGTLLYYFQQLNNDGVYFVQGMSLDAGTKYHLKINTPDGKLYLSDDIVVKQTPPIDSVSWQREDNGVRIYTSTHDDLNNTKYYRWDYVETWEYRSNFVSDTKYENNMLGARKYPEEQVYECWTTNKSTELLLGSSAKLSKDIISMKPIQFISNNTIQISVKYSIEVAQYALSREAFEYLENLKKITEQQGSIFDAQPNQVTGNIHSADNPAEPVLGYVTATTKQTKRIFIDHEEVNPWQYLVLCDDSKLITYDSVNYYFGSPGGFSPINISVMPSGVVGAIANCVDCTLRGGSNQKPFFWP